MKVTARANVTLELSIDLVDNWGGTTQIDQINKQARDSLNGTLQRLVVRINTPNKENGDNSLIKVKCTTLDRKISLDLTESKP